jgi:HEPN domain-containing protein
MIDKTKIRLWIKIALDDLHSATILYNNKQHRNSFALFQQATEKAVKASILMNVDLSDEELKKEVGHNQFKYFRKEIVKKEGEISNLTNTISAIPEIRDHEVINHTQMLNFGKGLDEMKRHIDALNPRDIINISAVELSRLHRKLSSFHKVKIEIPKGFEKPLISYFKKIIDLASKISTPEAQAARLEFEEFIQNRSKVKELIKLMKKILRIFLNHSFVIYTLYFCSILTLEHNTISRYPENGVNPFELYKRNLPLIKKQMLFMKLLEEGLTKMKVVVGNLSN